ncbi:MAG: hypothetical protein MJ156_01450 [Alphaproteobacteria bacterium]|nr:hypothetical protein [Alphaproteobacteria bacterium]
MKPQYIKNTITPKDINNKPKQIVDIALYYLEHGDLTDKQRYYLQQLASITSKQYKYFMRGMVFFTVISLICGITGTFVDEEIGYKMLEAWFILGATDLTLLFYNIIVKPTYYIRKLNQVSR